MWSRRFEKCVQCGGVQYKHVANGLCNSCYQRRYRNADENKDRIVSSKRQWYREHRDSELAKRKERREHKHFGGKRQAALEHAGHACERCSGTDQLTVHHRDRQGRGNAAPNNVLENLEVLCRACHLAEHREEILQAVRAKRAARPPQLGKSGRWSQKYDACVCCGLQCSPHASKGECAICYQRNKRQARTR